MRIIARGRIGKGPEADLVTRYMTRMPWPIEVTELPDSPRRNPRSGPPSPTSVTILLDECGEALTSLLFARRLANWRDTGVDEVRFLIGGADGHDAATRDSADFIMSFGPATWPHLLVRAMLTEQLYRATAILSGHPYHRGGSPGA